MLLDFETQLYGKPWHEWDGWFAAMKLPRLRSAGELRFSHYDQVIDAAMRGSGVAVGKLPHLSEHLRDGRLMAPLGDAARVHLGAFFIEPCRCAQADLVREFVDWLRSEARRDGAPGADTTPPAGAAVQPGSFERDVDPPLPRAAELLDFLHREIGIVPIGICPIRAADPQRCFTLYPLRAGLACVNFGSWDVVETATAQQPGHCNRLVDLCPADGEFLLRAPSSMREAGEAWRRAPDAPGTSSPKGAAPAPTRFTNQTCLPDAGSAAPEMLLSLFSNGHRTQLSSLPLSSVRQSLACIPSAGSISIGPVFNGPVAGRYRCRDAMSPAVWCLPGETPRAAERRQR